MSIEVDAKVLYVCVSDDNINGSSISALEATEKALFNEQGYSKISKALGEIINGERGSRETLDRFKAAGRFLMGTHSEYLPAGIRVKAPFDALLYAEGGMPAENAAFSVVRMATWVRQSAADKALYFGESTPLDRLIQAALKDITSLVENDRRMGVPVSRLTRIASFDEDDNGYVFGHREDLEAVEALEVPDRLKSILTAVTSAYDTSELEHGGKAVFADILDALEDQHF